MFEFKNTVICDEILPRVKVTVWVDVSDGCLQISGQDLGEAVADIWHNDDNEYEYFRTLDQENTLRLYKLLSVGGKNPNTEFLERFSGLNGFTNFGDFCETNGIIYTFFSC